LDFQSFVLSFQNTGKTRRKNPRNPELPEITD
jgi:hypothetical protein